MSVLDPTKTHHADNLQQEEDISTGAVSMVLIISTIVSIVGGFIAWFLLHFFASGQRPNMAMQDYPERRIGKPGEIKQLAIEQEYFYDHLKKGQHSISVTGELDRDAQVKTLHSYGKSSVEPNEVRIPIDAAMKLFTEQQAKGQK